MNHPSHHLRGLLSLACTCILLAASPAVLAQSTGIEFPLGATSSFLQINAVATGYNGGALPIAFASELKYMKDIYEVRFGGLAIESAPIPARSCRSVSVVLRGSSTILALPFGVQKAPQETLFGCVEIVDAVTDKVLGRCNMTMWISRAAQQHDTSVTRQLTVSLADLPPDASVIIRLVGDQGIAPDLVGRLDKSRHAFIPKRFMASEAKDAGQVH